MYSHNNLDRKLVLAAPFEYQLTRWAAKKQLAFAAKQLLKYHTDFVWKRHNRKSAIFIPKPEGMED